MKSRTTRLRRAAATTTALGVAVAGALTVSAAPASAAPKSIATPYAYQGWAYGTKVTAQAGGANLGSGPTARSILGCTKVAPRAAKPNYLTQTDLNNMLKVGAVESTVNTYRRPARKRFGSRSVNVLTDVVIGDPAGPHLKVGAVRTISDAYNLRGRFRAHTDIKWFGLEAVRLSPEGSETPEELNNLIGAIEDGLNEAALQIIGNAGEIDIPGVGTIRLGSESKAIRPRTATARTFALKIDLENGSTANLGHAWARIRSDVPFGVFNGSAHASEAALLQDNVRVGRVANQPLPCQGTGGKWISNKAADVNLPGLNLTGPTGEVFGKSLPRTGRSVARTRAYVSRVNLGDGQLVLGAFRGQANVVTNRQGRIVARNTNGTRMIGSITANGETYEAPETGALEIPGVATIRFGVTRRLGTRGIKVIAAQVELADGAGALINLGVARARIDRA